MRRVIYQLLLVAAMGSLAWAAESTPAIGGILSDPQDFHAHNVALKGTIRQLKEGPSPLPCKLGLRYDAAYFTLEDATGSIPIEFLGTCGGGPDAAQHLSEGDKVTVHATIIWDHQYPGSAYAVAFHVLQEIK